MRRRECPTAALVVRAAGDSQLSARSDLNVDDESSSGVGRSLRSEQTSLPVRERLAHQLGRHAAAILRLANLAILLRRDTEGAQSGEQRCSQRSPTPIRSNRIDRNGAMPDLCPQLQPSAPLHATSMSRFLTFLMRTIALIDIAGLREGKRGREKGRARVCWIELVNRPAG